MAASLLTAVSIALLATTSIPVTASAQQRSSAAVSVGGNDLGGVVRSAKGPEAGVWVIAETTDTPTRYTKIVVTDDRGRYLVPDLPKGNYQVWVRGYGLIDSAKVQASLGQTSLGQTSLGQTSLGKTLDLTAVPAPRRRPPRRNIIRRSIGSHCCRCPRKANSRSIRSRARANG